MSRVEHLSDSVGDQWVTIYALCQPVGRWHTGPVRYVGKTTRQPWARVRAHSYAAKRSPRLPVHRWLLKQMDAGQPFHIRHLEQVPPGQDWAARERFWISKLRDEGCRLLNLTEGGEGLAGLPMADEHKAKIAAALRTGSVCTCERCGTSFWRKKNQIEKGHARFCSRRCSNRRFQNDLV